MALHYLLNRTTSTFNESNRTVAELVNEILVHWPGRWTNNSDPNALTKQAC